MKLGLFTAAFDDYSLEQVAAYAVSLGYEAIELPAWRGNPHLDIDAVVASGARRVRETVAHYELSISALNNALEGQLVLGPLDSTTDAWAPSCNADEKVCYAMDRLKQTARAAAELGVPVVNVLMGSPVWDKWYGFPEANIGLYEAGWQVFAERWGEIADEFARCGVRIGFEPHPVSIAYNIETAERVIATLDGRREVGFNFDPSHFVWQMIDPVLFVKRFGDRIYHSHAKDCELIWEELPRAGVMSAGSLTRPDRGWRFRAPGWGQIDWRRLITALTMAGFDGVLSYEHEDPILSREDACEKTVHFLKPLLIRHSPRTSVQTS